MKKIYISSLMARLKTCLRIKVVKYKNSQEKEKEKTENSTNIQPPSWGSPI
jgi:hypothetical protein